MRKNSSVVLIVCFQFRDWFLEERAPSEGVERQKREMVICRANGEILAIDVYIPMSFGDRGPHRRCSSSISSDSFLILSPSAGFLLSSFRSARSFPFGFSLPLSFAVDRFSLSLSLSLSPPCSRDGSLYIYLRFAFLDCIAV